MLWKGRCVSLSVVPKEMPDTIICGTAGAQSLPELPVQLVVPAGDNGDPAVVPGWWQGTKSSRGHCWFVCPYLALPGDETLCEALPNIGMADMG